jgi:hypothetical protein
MRTKDCKLLTHREGRAVVGLKTRRAEASVVDRLWLPLVRHEAIVTTRSADILSALSAQREPGSSPTI